jgi:antitoxin (DNA-binding transcriptional repressor) of toxin-antitoxin stability system
MLTNMARANKQVNIAEAKATLSELVRRASMAEEVLIAEDNHPIHPLTGKRRPGCGRGQVLFIAADFDLTPDVFADYLL